MKKYTLFYWADKKFRTLETDSFFKIQIFKLCVDWSSFEVNSRKRLKMHNGISKSK